MDVRRLTTTQQVLARRQQLGEDIIGYAHEIKIHALGRLGELLTGLEKATGTKRPKGSKGATGRVIGGTTGEPPMGPPTLADLGISKKESALAQALADLPRTTRNAIAKARRELMDSRNVHAFDRRPPDRP